MLDLCRRRRSFASCKLTIPTHDRNQLLRLLPLFSRPHSQEAAERLHRRGGEIRCIAIAASDIVVTRSAPPQLDPPPIRGDRAAPARHDILFSVGTKTGIRSGGGRRAPPRAAARLALLLVASAGGFALAEEAAPAPSGAGTTNATDAGPPEPAPAPAPLSAAAMAARAAARVAARALPGSAAPPCPSRAASAVAAIDFKPAGRVVDVWFVPFAAASRPVRVTTLPRHPDSPVAAVALTGTDQVAVSVVRRVERDPTWSATLLLAGPGQKSRVLLERVFAGGPLVATADRHVIAVRGAAGAAQAPSAAGAGVRRDGLEVVAVDVSRANGQVRTISRQTGDALVLVGATTNELFAYRAGVPDAPLPAGRRQASNGSDGRTPPGELISIELGTGTVRVVVPVMPPFARDFSFDSVSGTIWFAAMRPPLDEEGAAAGKKTATKEQGARYALYGLDGATALLSVVVTGDSLAFLPQAWPGDRVAFRCQDGSNALCLANRPGAGGRGRADHQVAHLIGNAAASAEVQVVSCTDAGEVAFGVRRDADRPFSTPFLWMMGDVAARDVALPAGQVRFVGVVDLTAAAGVTSLPALTPAAR